MNRDDRAKNAAFLCCHFARNFAYYGAGQRQIGGTSDLFWSAVLGNFVDVAVLEWCKLFGNRNGKYHWKRVLTDPTTFLANMPRGIGIAKPSFDTLYVTVKTYRDEFVAHLEDNEVAMVPNMNIPYVLTWSYYLQLSKDYPFLLNIDELPRDFGNYWASHSEAATAIFSEVAHKASNPAIPCGQPFQNDLPRQTGSNLSYVKR